MARNMVACSRGRTEGQSEPNGPQASLPRQRIFAAFRAAVDRTRLPDTESGMAPASSGTFILPNNEANVARCCRNSEISGLITCCPIEPLTMRSAPFAASARSSIKSISAQQSSKMRNSFPSTAGTWRDPDNFRARWREVREALGVPDVTSHSFRKTVATLIDDEGLSARIGADHLGHARVSETQDTYMARGRSHTAVAELLERTVASGGRP